MPPKITTYETELQVEIERLEHSDVRGNYRIVTGNPLSGSVETEIFASQLKINGYAAAVKYLELSEHNETIVIEHTGTKANIILKNG